MRRRRRLCIPWEACHAQDTAGVHWSPGEDPERRQQLRVMGWCPIVTPTLRTGDSAAESGGFVVTPFCRCSEGFPSVQSVMWRWALVSWEPVAVSVYWKVEGLCVECTCVHICADARDYALWQWMSEVGFEYDRLFYIIVLRFIIMPGSDGPCL